MALLPVKDANWLILDQLPLMNLFSLVRVNRAHRALLQGYPDFLTVCLIRQTKSKSKLGRYGNKRIFDWYLDRFYPRKDDVDMILAYAKNNQNHQLIEAIIGRFPNIRLYPGPSVYSFHKPAQPSLRIKQWFWQACLDQNLELAQQIYRNYTFTEKVIDDLWWDKSMEILKCHYATSPSPGKLNEKLKVTLSVCLWMLHYFYVSHDKKELWIDDLQLQVRENTAPNVVSRLKNDKRLDMFREAHKRKEGHHVIFLWNIYQPRYHRELYGLILQAKLDHVLEQKPWLVELYRRPD